MCSCQWFPDFIGASKTSLLVGITGHCCASDGCWMSPTHWQCLRKNLLLLALRNRPCAAILAGYLLFTLIHNLSGGPSSVFNRYGVHDIWSLKFDFYVEVSAVYYAETFLKFRWHDSILVSRWTHEYHGVDDKARSYPVLPRIGIRNFFKVSGNVLKYRTSRNQFLSDQSGSSNGNFLPRFYVRELC